jgi:plasmid maintenance system antidote protein VapI
MMQRKLRLSEQLRQAIAASELSRYRIAEATEISQSTLSLFCSGKRGLSMDAIDRLVEFFGWEIGPPRAHRKKG